MRITISGTPGSGKSTVGKALAKRLNMPFHEEQWKDNPFIPYGDPSLGLVVYAEQNDMRRHGVYDTDLISAAAIYTTLEERQGEFLRKVLLKEWQPIDYRFALILSKGHLEERIVDRGNELAQLDLAANELRVKRYWELLESDDNFTPVYVRRGMSVDQVVKTILAYLS